jgi:hypothetical protein
MRKIATRNTPSPLESLTNVSVEPTSIHSGPFPKWVNEMVNTTASFYHVFMLNTTASFYHVFMLNTTAGFYDVFM